MPERQLDINPSMVTLARESRGMTQTDLSQRLGVTQGWVSRVEGEGKAVSEALLVRLAETTGYPVDFFLQQDRIYGIDASILYHRKRADVPVKLLTKIHAQVNVRRMHIARMLKSVDIGEVNFKEFDLAEYGGKASEVSRVVRAMWKVPAGPVRNLIQLIEDARGIVIPFDFETSRIDAICLWPSDTPPLFFVNTRTPGDRLRFTLCHELAHIFLHRRDLNPDMEDQANAFAASFLMPERDIRPYLTDLSISKLGNLKLYWKVSMSSLVYRAKELGIISDRQASRFYAQMSPWRTVEPAEYDIPREQPLLLQEIIDTFRSDMGYSVGELSKHIHMLESETKALYVHSSKHLRAIK